MRPYLLPASRAYGCIDEPLVDATLSRICDRFTILLTAGRQIQDLGPDARAAGQYLDRLEFPQRGLFGTAAALYVLSRAGAGSAALELAQRLVNYLHVREELEPSLAATPQERAETERRIEVERADSFKTADVIYALVHTSHQITGRDTRLRLLTARVLGARRTAGGWGVRLDPDEPFDALATAHLVRALHATGLPVEDTDLAQLTDFLARPDDSRSSPYVRTFIITVLARIDLTRYRPIVTEQLRILAHRLPATADPAEANYEYTAGRRQYYVRIPWQLYLLETALRRYPTTRFFTWPWQRQLLSIANAVDSPNGYLYPASGSAQSTRTNAIVCDLFLQIRTTLRTAPRTRIISTLINGATRVAYSKATGFSTGLLAVALITYTAITWWQNPNRSSGDLAPNFISAAILILAQFGLRRFRR